MNLTRLRAQLEKFLDSFDHQLDQDTTEAANLLIDRLSDLIYQQEEDNDDNSDDFLSDEVEALYSNDDDDDDDDN